MEYLGSLSAESMLVFRRRGRQDDDGFEYTVGASEREFAEGVGASGREYPEEVGERAARSYGFGARVLARLARAWSRTC